MKKENKTDNLYGLAPIIEVIIVDKSTNVVTTGTE